MSSPWYSQESNLTYRDTIQIVWMKHMPNPYVSLYVLDNLSVDLLNDIAHEDIYTPIQYLNPDSQVPYVYVEVPTKE